MDNTNLLWRKGNHEILSKDVGALSPGEMNLLIKHCGTISHQSWKTSKKTPEEFIEMLFQWRHLSVLEHSWFSVLFNFKFSTEKEKTELELLKGNHLFCITERSTNLIVSGNARMFTEAYLRNPNTTTATLLNFLRQKNQVLFPLEPKKEMICPQSFILNPPLKTEEETLVHRAMTVIFQYISRGFSHETVRSRSGHNKIAAYTQRSTRYVNPFKKNGFNFIFPYRKDLFTKIPLARNIAFTNKEIIVLFSSIYKRLIDKGLKPEEARQWLPIGIETEIVQTMNYSEWLHWFVIRTQKAAHPEIRFVACNLLRQVQNDIPNIFEGFQFNKDKDGICYTKFTSPYERNIYLI